MSVHCWLTAAGSIPQELGALDKLEVLLLFSNKLSGELPRDSNGFARPKRWVGKRVPDTLVPLLSTHDPGYAEEEG